MISCKPVIFVFLLIGLSPILISCGGYPPERHKITMDGREVEEIWPATLECKSPKYPEDAISAGVHGTVWIKALINPQGDVDSAKVGRTSGSPSLDSAAVRPAYHCKYTPGYRDGKPIAAWVTYRVDFELP